MLFWLNYFPEKKEKEFDLNIEIFYFDLNIEV